MAKPCVAQDADNVVIDASNLGVSAITATGDFTLNGVRVTGGSSASNGGGIFANVAGTNINLNNVVFDNNSADLDGGAVYLRDGTLTATNATFTSNSADDGNGGAIFSGTVANISGSQFNLNQAAENGGAIATTGTLTSGNNTFQSNNADNGGAISVDSGDTPSANSSDDLFTANTATRDGGAIYESGSTLDISGGVFQSNTAGDSGGFAGDGGAIYSDSSTEINEGLLSAAIPPLKAMAYPEAVVRSSMKAPCSVVDTTIDGSVANAGGGVYNTNGSPLMSAILRFQTTTQATMVVRSPVPAQ